jgi:hypothetical protein
MRPSHDQSTWRTTFPLIDWSLRSCATSLTPVQVLSEVVASGNLWAVPSPPTVTMVSARVEAPLSELPFFAGSRQSRTSLHLHGGCGSYAGTSSHTTAHMTTWIEVVGRVSGRRRWTVEQKPAILRDAFGAGGWFRLPAFGTRSTVA